MPIIASDVLFKLSVTSGTAGNSTAQANPNLSLGKYVSTTVWAAGTNTLFDNVSGDENAASTVDYRCFFVHNAHASLTLESAVVYVSAEVAGGASVAIAVDSIAASAIGTTAAQAAQIASETTAPTGTGAFSTPTTKAGGLALGNIGPGQCRAVWVRRTAANSSPVNADGFTVSVAGDTAQ